MITLHKIKFLYFKNIHKNLGYLAPKTTGDLQSLGTLRTTSTANPVFWHQYQDDNYSALRPRTPLTQAWIHSRYKQPINNIHFNPKGGLIYHFRSSVANSTFWAKIVVQSVHRAFVRLQYYKTKEPNVTLLLIGLTSCSKPSTI
jgi:hypothetical protein